ncbi:MAG: hypothetical protein BWY16_00558 [Candidatus Omnitrophica bacterium ADurb.Bin205]|nr:MAG: hypothetical protein BWY16_00558 [Candidatus Omnitrophica bacterium ADurb.Bin205]
MKLNAPYIKVLVLLVISGTCAFLGFYSGFTLVQSLICFVFLTSILGTLFFWDLRESLVFLGSAVLFLTRSVNLESFIKFASLDAIFFLGAPESEEGTRVSLTEWLNISPIVGLIPMSIAYLAVVYFVHQ